MKLARLRFQSIFSFAFPSDSLSEEPSPRSCDAAGLLPTSAAKAGAATALESIVGNNAVKLDKSIIGLIVARPFGVLTTIGFPDGASVNPFCADWSAWGCVW